jgi:hypothetical protein
VKTALQGKRFQDGEDIKKNVMAELNAVPLEAFADCFQKLFERCNKCNQVGGDYVDRNKIMFYFLVFFISFFTPVRELYCQTTYHIIPCPEEKKKKTGENNFPCFDYFFAIDMTVLNHNKYDYDIIIICQIVIFFSIIHNQGLEL